MLYSGDRPNPSLRAFVEDHLAERPLVSAAEAYQKPPFTRHIETTKRSPVFGMHGYHVGKKPHDAIQAYIEHYTHEGDLVLDPFCGSGSSALAALTMGRKAIAIDASPAATFIARFYLSGCDPSDLAARFQEMCMKVAPEMEYLYGTTCHRCGAAATIHHVIYSNIYPCPGCARPVSLFEAFHHGDRCCPHCLTETGERRSIHPNLGTIGYQPVAVNFSCHGSCRPRRVTRSGLGPATERNAFFEIDLPQLHEIEGRPIPYPFPQHFMMHIADPSVPWGDEWRPSRDFRRVSDLFTYRNLCAVAAFMNAAGSDDDLRAVITSGMLAVSRKAQHLATGGGYIPGNWALPPMSKQRNVAESLKKVFRRILAAKRSLAGILDGDQARISTQSAASMKEIPDCSVDYVFTDPPYGGSIQYGELNFVWEAWLGLNTNWHHEEMVVNQARNRSHEEWARMLHQAMSECHRVLKPGRWLSLCWHDSSSGTWPVIQQIMSDAGFLVGDSSELPSIDTGSHTYNQRISDKPVKRELVVNFRKPRIGELAMPANVALHRGLDFAEQAREVIRDFLRSHPGSTKDRIYDHLISVMIRCGRLERHNFDKLLSEVARRTGERKSRWTLK